MSFLIPAGVLSFLSITAGILCFFGYKRVEVMERSSVVQMSKLGIVLLAPSLITFGFLYFYIQNYEVVAEIRQILFRILLSYLFVSVNIWQIILLKWGKTL